MLEEKASSEGAVVANFATTELAIQKATTEYDIY